MNRTMRLQAVSLVGYRKNTARTSESAGSAESVEDDLRDHIRVLQFAIHISNETQK